jgi:SET domain-containing protein
LEINTIEQDPEKFKKIEEICDIYFTNSFDEGFCVKMSRFNHSCQPNAVSFEMNGQLQLRAIGNIKAGKEININYLDELTGFRNRKYHQQNLLELRCFICYCDLCENVLILMLKLLRLL